MSRRIIWAFLAAVTFPRLGWGLFWAYFARQFSSILSGGDDVKVEQFLEEIDPTTSIQQMRDDDFKKRHGHRS